MPFAVVLTRAGRCFYLRLSRFSARKSISGSGLCPLTMLRHLANLQAPNALRQGIPPFLSEHSPGLSVSTFSPLFAMQVHYSAKTTLAPAPRIYNSRDAPWLCAGWPAPMNRPLITKLQFVLGLS